MRRKPIPELAVYKTELPPPLELAKLAAAVGPRDNYREAIRNASKLYFEACKFHLEFTNAQPKERALMFDDWKAAEFDAVSAFSPEFKDLHCPKRFPAPFDEFLSRVVAGKTTADRMKNLRDYFQYEFKLLMAYRALPADPEDRPCDLNVGEDVIVKLRSPDSFARANPCYRNCNFFLSYYHEGQDDMDFAAAQLKRLKAEGLNDDQWYALGGDYLAWWRQEKSKKASQSGKKPKKKKSASP